MHPVTGPALRGLGVGKSDRYPRSVYIVSRNRWVAWSDRIGTWPT